MSRALSPGKFLLLRICLVVSRLLGHPRLRILVAMWMSRHLMLSLALARAGVSMRVYCVIDISLMIGVLGVLYLKFVGYGVGLPFSSPDHQMIITLVIVFQSIAQRFHRQQNQVFSQPPIRNLPSNLHHHHLPHSSAPSTIHHIATNLTNNPAYRRATFSRTVTANLQTCNQARGKRRLPFPRPNNRLSHKILRYEIPENQHTVAAETQLSTSTKIS